MNASPTRKFAALCGKEKEHPMNRFRPKNVPLAELCFVGNAVLQSAPTQQKRLASQPRPPDPDFAGILRIPAKSAPGVAVHAADHDGNSSGSKFSCALPVFFERLRLAARQFVAKAFYT
ncbi:MAG: hypothetical protein PUD50_06995, partial [Eubacteriales bacterium]|nr:hypothetical protein [Eubacteriales bacterium]